MKKLIIIPFVLIATQIFSQTANKKPALPKYSAMRVKQDLAYLYTTLQASTYDLFVHTPKRSFDLEFEKMNRFLDKQDSLTKLETIKLFQTFAAKAQLAHCTFDPPFYDVYNQYKSENGTLFPLGVRIEDDHVYIKQNYSGNKSLGLGDEIISINGKPISDYLKDMYNLLSGEDDYFKSTLIDLYTFPKMFWELYGRPAGDFTVMIRKLNTDIKMVINIKPIVASEFDKVNKGVTEILHFGREFKFINSETAYYHPGIFLNTDAGSTSNHKTFEKGEFIHFLDSAFLQIHLKKSKFLIIDLRGNPGGDNSFSDPMVAYFAKKPFWYCSRFSIKTSEITKKFWKDITDSSLLEIKNKILSHKDGEVFEVTLPQFQPRTDSLRFTGKVYVLINRYSYSNATTTPAMIQDYGFGKIVGEPTADCPTLYAAIHDFKLPNTQLAVGYPKAFMVRPNGSTKVQGVMPDYAMPKNISEEDAIAYTLKIIEGEK